MRQAQAKRAPAYAAQLLQLRRRGISPVGSLCIAADWKLGKRIRWRIVVPIDIAPELVDFQVAAGLDCLLMGNDQARMDAIARELLKLELARLIGACTNPPKITVYWPG